MVTAAMKLKDACSLEEKLQPTLTVLLKGRGTRNQIANIKWIIEKAREENS